MASFKVLNGIDYPPNKRAEIGDVVTDLPTKDIKWLLEVGAIESYDGKTPVVEEEPVTETPVVETPVEAPTVETPTPVEETN
jgi:hypothetical protein